MKSFMDSHVEANHKLAFAKDAHAMKYEHEISASRISHSSGGSKMSYLLHSYFVIAGAAAEYPEYH